MNPPSDPATTNLPVLAILVLVASTIFAVPLSRALLSIYRRRVIAAMAAASAQGGRAAVIGTHDAATHSPPPSEVALAASPPTAALSQEAESLRARCARRPWRAAGVYATAGAAFASVLTIAQLRAADIPFGTTRFLALLFIFAWPLVPTIGLAAASSRRAKVAIVAPYFGAVGLLSAFAVARSPGVALWQLAFLWLAVNLVPSLFLPAVFTRRVRAVGPLVLAFLAVAGVGVVYAWEILTNEAGVLEVAVRAGHVLGLGPWGVVLGFSFLGLIVFGAGGWLLLVALRRAYERKLASDQSITVDAVWLLFAISGGAYISNNGAVWILTAPAAFAVYMLVAALGFRMLRSRDRALIQRRPARLLLLRVFSLGRRSEHLYHVVETHWRHVGSIQLITGPDLATTTIEPHEFLDFLRGRLARRFIDSTEALDTRLEEMDLRPDLDGRYRVNDFFCRDDTWRAVLGRLVAQSDLALMDLRGFTTRHAGCEFEIKALVDAVPLERIVLLIDGGTDEPYLRQVIRDGWAEIRADSPNRGVASPQLRLVRLTRLGSGEIGEILAALARAATARGAGTDVPLAPGLAHLGAPGVPILRRTHS